MMILRNKEKKCFFILTLTNGSKDNLNIQCCVNILLGVHLVRRVSGTTGSSVCPGLLVIPIAETGAVVSAIIYNSSNI